MTRMTMATTLERKLALRFRTRNFGICAHIDAGKTTCSERILFYTGKIHKTGEVHLGTSEMDTTDDERKKGITIESAATTCEWTVDDIPYRLNLIDTPGHVDFTIEVERSMRVLDGAVTVFDGKEGVEAQSETVWRQADKYSVPRICFINKMDKPGADFEASMQSIRDRLGVNAVAVQLPLGSGDELEGVIDLIEMKAYRWSAATQGREYDEVVIPETQLANAEAWRAKLMEAAAEMNESAMASYLETGELSQAEIEAALRQGTLSQNLFPVLCGSALKNVGIQRLIDAVVKYLPNPAECPETEGSDPKDEDIRLSRLHDEAAPFAALVFKIVNDEHGDLTFLRVYSGSLVKGTRVLNSNTGKKEKISRIFEMHANKRHPKEEMKAGEIVAVTGLKSAVTGHTLCAPEAPIVLDRMDFPVAVIAMSIEPVNGSDKDKLSAALATFKREDPSFHAYYDEETGETIIGGMGELHLEIMTNKLTRDKKIPVTLGKPRVAYREALKGRGQARERLKKQTSGPGQFAECELVVEPYTAAMAEEEGLRFEDEFCFENRISQGAIPKEYIPSVGTGAKKAAQSGVLAGYPMVGVKVSLIDGAFHQQDSSTVAFESVAVTAFKSAANSAGLQLLEPYMNVEVTTPEDYLGNVIGDLNRRRALITHQFVRGNTKVILAAAPLSEMFGYASTLRGMSQGRASFSMQPLDYRPVPERLAQEIISDTETR